VAASYVVASFSQLAGFGVVFNVLNGCEVVVEDAVILRGDVPCAWMKDKRHVAGVLGGVTEVDADSCTGGVAR